MNALDIYGREARRLLDEAIDRERDALERVAGIAADAVAGGGLIYLTGTGHAHLMAEEVFYRAGGLAAVYPILVPALMLHEGAIRSTRLERRQGLAREAMAELELGPGDLLIVASNSGRNAFPIEAALVGHERGTPVVALTSVPHGQSVTSRHPSGRRLIDVADVIVNTGAPYGDAVVPLGEGRPTVAPVSTVLGAFLLNAMMARCTQLLFERGVEPDVFSSANLEDGESLSEERTSYWRDRVRLL